MNRLQNRFYSDNPQARPRLNHGLDSDTIIARSWVRLGVNYVQKRYYMKAFLCFETALSMDSMSMNLKHCLIRRLILAGKLQEAYEFVSKENYPYALDVKEPWALA